MGRDDCESPSSLCDAVLHLNYRPLTQLLYYRKFSEFCQAVSSTNFAKAFTIPLKR